MRALRVLSAISAVLCVEAAPAAAQPQAHAPVGRAAPPSEPSPPTGAVQVALPPDYIEAFVAGVEEFSHGNYAEARTLLLRAHAILPNARTLRSLGMVEFELRHYGVCIELLDAALASTVRPLSEDLRQQVQSLRERALGFVGEYRLTLTPEIAKLRVDGRVHDGERGLHRLILDVGDHKLEVSAEGYATLTRGLRVAGGDRQELPVALTPLSPGGTAEAPSPRPAPNEERSWLTSPALWITTAVVVAAITGIAIATHDAGQASASGGDTGVVLTVPGAAGP